MDYCLAAGDGTASIWTAPVDLDLDGDGESDALRMDFDGDGLFDDALADVDDDGSADQAALDLDDDGVPESRFTDDGSGTWAVSGTGSATQPRWFGLDGIERTGPGDVDGDGVPERLFDTDRDGLADRAIGSDAATGYVDTDGDGRWDIGLTDLDGDGSADQAGGL